MEKIIIILDIINGYLLTSSNSVNTLFFSIPAMKMIRFTESYILLIHISTRSY